MREIIVEEIVEDHAVESVVSVRCFNLFLNEINDKKRAEKIHTHLFNESSRTDVSIQSDLVDGCKVLWHYTLTVVHVAVELSTSRQMNHLIGHYIIVIYENRRIVIHIDHIDFDRYSCI